MVLNSLERDVLIRLSTEGWTSPPVFDHSLLDRVVEAGVEIGPARFYPYKDRYLDEVRISGGRDEVVGVAVAIRSVTSGTVVRTFVMAPAKGKIRLSWNGLTDAGTRAPAGFREDEALVVVICPAPRSSRPRVRIRPRRGSRPASPPA